MSAIPRTIPNPAWTESEEANLQRRLTMDDMARRGECAEDAFPDEYGKLIPEGGCWIMLLTAVRVGRVISEDQVKQITIPHLSMWFALPHLSNARVAVHSMGKIKAKDREWAHLHQGILNTPDGPVHVWPHEYTVIDINRFLGLCDDDGLFIYYLSAEASIDEAALFYLRSRGITKAEAQRMLLGTLRDSNFCYFTVSPEISDVIGEGSGMPYLTSRNHERRAAARKKLAGGRK